jgi:triacylglycerol lipase
MIASAFEQTADRQRVIADIGRSMSGHVRGATAELYVPFFDAPFEYTVVRDVFYGPDPRHRLDLHLPTLPAGPDVPIVLFVHGGGFAGGDKATAGSPFYDNIGRWAVSNGFVGVTMTYRLAPTAIFPSGAEDIAAALAWLQSSLTQYGVASSRIVLMGHSAGAAHAASFLALSDLHLRLDRMPVGTILSSGIYELSDDTDEYSVYYGTDPSERARASSLGGLSTTNVPLLVSGAEFDPPEFHLQFDRLLASFRQRNGHLPQLLQADGHNHFSVMFQLGSPETWFGDRLARFVARSTLDDAG